MADLGSLFYDVRLRDLTDQDIQAITRKLQNIGINLDTQKFKDTIKTAVEEAEKRKLKLEADPNALSTSIQQIVRNGVKADIDKQLLYQSIEGALKSRTFDINIQVMKGQARQAVQNALNQASNLTASDALKYQRLMTGESKAARAELDRLKASHISARDAASAHAHASINLGGALGSNIRIAGELGAAMASMYSIHAAKEFLSQVIEIGGELEHQKIALDTIFGDKGKTSELFGQIKGLARESPFGVMEITKSVKALAAYGVQYNEVYDTAKRLADISAATSIDINRLILAFGKTKSRTFLDGLEAKQFAYTNIPIYDLLSKKLTELEGKFVSVQEVMGRIKKREIGFDLVKEVLWDMTDEGGKFYNMQEQLAGSVKTAWKLVRDNIELMYGEIAESAVGEGLKDVAQILQTLTKNWQILGAMLGSAGAGFLIYKTAVMAAGVATAHQTTSELKSIASKRSIIAANNAAAASYRDLTQAEITEQFAAQGAAKIKGLAILNSKMLTGAEAEALMAKKLLTREDVLRLVALKKITAAEAEYALVTVGMTQKDIAATQAEINHAASIGRTKVMMNQALQAAKGYGMTLLRFAFNPFTLALAGISALTYAFSKNKEEMEKAKEIADTLFTKASEGAKNLKTELETLSVSDGLSTLELQQGIEKMQNLIKDYSPTPIDDINDSLVAQDGHVRSLIEQYDFLEGKILRLSFAFDYIRDSKVNDWIESGINATNGKNWFTSLFVDDINEEAKDYTNALKKRSDNITKFVANNAAAVEKAVKAAEKASEGFRSAVENMATYEEKFRHILENGADFSAYNALSKSLTDVDLIDLRNTKNVYDSYSKMQQKMQEFAENMNANMRSNGWNPAKLRQEQKIPLAIAINSWLDQLNDAGEEAKDMMRDYFSNLWDVPLQEDKITPAFQKAWRNAVKEGDDAVKRMAIELQNGGYDNLSDASRNVFQKLAEQTRRQVMKDLGITSGEMQKYLQSHPLEQTIQLVYSQNAPSELAKEIISKKGYPGLTNEINQKVTDWTKSGNAYESRNAAQEALQAAKNELDAAKKAKVGIEKAQKEYDEVWAALQYLGWTDLATKDQKSNKSGSGSKKDPVAEMLKQRFKDLKDAWSEVQKWQKSVGKDAAYDKVAESGLFSAIPKEKIPKTAEEFYERVDELRSELEKAGIKGHSQRESLLNELLKELLAIDKSQVDEKIKVALDMVEREYERQLKNWDFYDSVYRATGNKNLAISLAFGVDAEANTDYVSLVKKQFNEMAEAAKKARPDIKILNFDEINDSNKTSLPDELQKAWEEATKKIASYAEQQRKEVADILKEYQSAQEKIQAINAERDRKLKSVQSDSGLSAPQKENLTMRINAEADYKVFEQSTEYLKFFSSIYSLTLAQAQQIGDTIRQNLDARLQAGTISAEDYYKEIERINEQVDKLKNVRSNAFTFMTSGLEGLFKKQTEENESNRSKVVIEIQKAEEEIAKAKEQGDSKARKAAETRLTSLKKELAIYDKIRDKIIRNQKLAEDISSVVSIVDNIAGGLMDSFNTIKDMADSFGVDTESAGWDAVGTALESLTTITGGISSVFQSALKGDIGGILSGVVDTLLTPITIWNQFHDRRLQKDIEKSQRQMQQIDYMIDAIERRMEHYLGNRKFSLVPGIDEDMAELAKIQRQIDNIKRKGRISESDFWKLSSLEKEKSPYQARVDAYNEGGALGYERQLMSEELAEMERQKADMEAMKKKDPEAYQELLDQIDEQKQAIRDFAEEMAETVYGINLSDWANQFGDALVDAFAKGEDAAEAFDKTAGNILRSLVSKMISTNILAPMFQDLQKYLFGEDGMSGAYGSDFELDASEVGAMKEYLDTIRDKGIPAAEDLYNAINEATGGLLDDVESADNSVRAGIQNITEDTADLLASYINAIRAYCAENNLNFNTFFRETMPRLSAIAEGQLAQLTMIAENTRRNMVAAEAMRLSAETIASTITKATTNKSFGFYVK
ncbi:MAG: hypothetical protein NC311_07595 [Muribaculaceae bacterium]|nr:hypothetical protein [Muribaculaceae bacterium]